jgi:hypothetical protein
MCLRAHSMRFSPSAARPSSFTALLCKINHPEIYLVNLTNGTYFQILKCNPVISDVSNFEINDLTDDIGAGSFMVCIKSAIIRADEYHTGSIRGIHHQSLNSEDTVQIGGRLVQEGRGRLPGKCASDDHRLLAVISNR